MPKHTNPKIPALLQHQYIDGETGAIVDEHLLSDPLVRFLYSQVREHAPFLFRMMTSKHWSRWVGYLNYESQLGAKLCGNERFLQECGLRWDECVEPVWRLDTPRKIFERQIRYWECRPLPPAPEAVVSPADSRVLVGSFQQTGLLPVKHKFFDYEELLGDRSVWREAFSGGDFALFRLTPDKYHYNHCPVSGEVRDFYEIDGRYHSCNPGALIAFATPCSKNKRTVTILDTDVPGGTGLGLVAMVEVVALMIGEVVQCYSRHRYTDPQPMTPGRFLQKGQPKSLFRPGSSTTILIFQKDRVEFEARIIANLKNPFAKSRYSFDLKTPLVETDVKVRSLIGSSKPHYGIAS